jgi:hypothetical protein
VPPLGEHKFGARRQFFLKTLFLRQIMEVTKSARARVSEALWAGNDAAKPPGRNSTFASRTLAHACYPLLIELIPSMVFND